MGNLCSSPEELIDKFRCKSNEKFMSDLVTKQDHHQTTSSGSPYSVKSPRTKKNQMNKKGNQKTKIKCNNFEFVCSELKTKKSDG